ncbi:MAG: RHS repeat-associated core domain-containing protein [Steroidobacteraceae bacterium]
MYQAGGVTATQMYLGRLVEKVTQGGTVDWRHTVFADDQAVAVYSRQSSGVNTLTYLLRDALGSVDGLTRRGYTGHEMLDSIDLIHMNGRVYDPVIARFVSADPNVDAGFGTQGWNRYTYVGNNPWSRV